jgi:hypothetical protein
MPRKRKATCAARDRASPRFKIPIGLATGPNPKFELELKKMKNSQNIFKNATRCVESNSLKNFQKFVYLIYFAGIRSLIVRKKY